MLQQYDQRNAELIVNVSGELVHRDEARISPFDSSVQNGDAVWEGLRVYDGRIFRLTQHLARLRRSAMALAYAGIPTDQAMTREIVRTLEANSMHDGIHIRLTLTRGVKYTSGLDPRVNQGPPTLIVLAEHKPPVYDKTGVRLKTSAHRRPPSDVLDQRIHSCNQLTSILAKLEANAAGADDALMLDTRGFVAETNATHLFLVDDAGTEPVVRTPATGACPEGITRRAVLDVCAQHSIAHEVADLGLSEFYRGAEVFCTGTMGEIAPVVEIDGRRIGDGSMGPVTTRISELFAGLVESESERVLG